MKGRERMQSDFLKKQIVKVTKEDATRFIEKDIKEVGRDISLLQELIEKAGIQ